MKKHIYALLAAAPLLFAVPSSSAMAGAAVDLFQHTPNAAISGANDRKVNGSVEACARACLDETGFICRSFDYNKISNSCDLSQATPATAGGLKTDYPDNPYDHYTLKGEAADALRERLTNSGLNPDGGTLTIRNRGAYVGKYRVVITPNATAVKENLAGDGITGEIVHEFTLANEGFEKPKTLDYPPFTNAITITAHVSMPVVADRLITIMPLALPKGDHCLNTKGLLGNESWDKVCN